MITLADVILAYIGAVMVATVFGGWLICVVAIFRRSSDDRGR